EQRQPGALGVAERDSAQLDLAGGALEATRAAPLADGRADVEQLDDALGARRGGVEAVDEPRERTDRAVELDAEAALGNASKARYVSACSIAQRGSSARRRKRSSRVCWSGRSAPCGEMKSSSANSLSAHPHATIRRTSGRLHARIGCITSNRPRRRRPR